MISSEKPESALLAALEPPRTSETSEQAERAADVAPVVALDPKDEALMREALEEARLAGEAGDVPVGAVVVDASGVVVGRGRNRREANQDPTAHAEVEALRDAAKARGAWRLAGCTVYVTMEPCPMCAGALVNARVARVVYGCADPKAGACDTLFTIGRDARLNHRFEIQGLVLGDECANLLRAFFAPRRKPQRPRQPLEPQPSEPQPLEPQPSRAADLDPS